MHTLSSTKEVLVISLRKGVADCHGGVAASSVGVLHMYYQLITKAYGTLYLRCSTGFMVYAAI